MNQDPSSSSPIDSRARRRVEAMLRVQDAAMRLFKLRGFDAVTVEEVAREAGVGVATVYRNFGMKEALVLWDEYDPLLLEAVARQLAGGQPPLSAVRAALIQQVGAVYQRDRDRILARADLTAETPALADAARLGIHQLRAALERVLQPHVPSRLTRELQAAVIASTLEVAVEAWRRGRARTKLGTLLERAFDELGVIARAQ